MVFNGEIYNVEGLRRRRDEKGPRLAWRGPLTYRAVRMGCTVRLGFCA